MNRESKGYAIATTLISFLAGIAIIFWSINIETNYPDSSKFLKTVGSFLTISVVISILYSIFIKPSEDASRKDELSNLLDKKINEIVTDKGKYGLSGIKKNIDFKALFSALSKNQTLWWLDTYPLGVGMWTEELKGALERGANIKMLVLSPQSENVTHRANELGNEFSPIQFKTDLERFLNLLKSIDQNELAGTLEVRTYDELIGLPLYIVSEKRKPVVGYSGFFLCAPTAAGSPHIKWENGNTPILSSMASYIESKWDRNLENLVL